MLVIWVTFALIYVLSGQVVGFVKDVLYEYQTLH